MPRPWERWSLTGACIAIIIFLHAPVRDQRSQALAQSGRSTTSSRRSTVINVIARRNDDPSRPRRLLSAKLTDEDAAKLIAKHEIELYDGGVFQAIESFAPDPTPARIVLLIDNSATVQTDIKKLAAVPAAFAPEIYEGDKVMVIGYDLKPEVITDFTDEPAALQGTLSLLRKTDQPRLFDSLNVVMEDVLRPAIGFSKRVIVVVGDGLDRGSQIKFDQIFPSFRTRILRSMSSRLAIELEERCARMRRSPKLFSSSLPSERAARFMELTEISRRRSKKSAMSCVTSATS